MQVGPVTLIGRHVRLEPLSPSHYERLVAIGAGQGIFRWFPYEIEAAENLTLYLHGCQAAMQAGTLIAFATIEQAADSAIGATCFLNIDAAHRRLEIGGTWIAPPWQRTAANTEAKYLQLRHAFEILGAVRVEFKTDALNERSQAALARIGAVREGTLRSHMICPGERLRDSVYFSVIASEWPAVKQRLERRLTG